MSVAKVIELTAEGSTIEKATEAAIKVANESVRNIKGVWLKDIKAVPGDDGSVDQYRVDAKVTFVVDEG